MNSQLEIVERWQDLIGNPISVLTELKAAKLYYCFYGRSAWHSTWVKKYTQNCMHLTLNDAQEFAEENRKPGSIFYIQALPAIRIVANDDVYYVTQINTSNPFMDYDRDANFNHLFHYGSAIQKVLKTLDADGSFWVHSQGEDSVITLITDGDRHHDYEPLTSAPLKTWKSESLGTNYYLSWTEIEQNIISESTLNFACKYGFSKTDYKKVDLIDDARKEPLTKAKKNCEFEHEYYYQTFEMLFMLRNFHLSRQEMKDVADINEIISQALSDNEYFAVIPGYINQRIQEEVIPNYVEIAQLSRKAFDDL